jgi:hypothetical protein
MKGGRAVLSADLIDGIILFYYLHTWLVFAAFAQLSVILPKKKCF